MVRVQREKIRSAWKKKKFEGEGEAEVLHYQMGWPDGTMEVHKLQELRMKSQCCFQKKPGRNRGGQLQE